MQHLIAAFIVSISLLATAGAQDIAPPLEALTRTCTGTIASSRSGYTLAADYKVKKNIAIHRMISISTSRCIDGTLIASRGIVIGATGYSWR